MMGFYHKTRTSSIHRLFSDVKEPYFVTDSRVRLPSL